MVAMFGTGEFVHLLNPDMPWNEEIRATWARQERLAASPGTVTLMLPLVAELNVRALLPTIRVPTLVVHHADDLVIPPEQGKDVAGHISGAKYVELPGRNVLHFHHPTAIGAADQIADCGHGARLGAAHHRAQQIGDHHQITGNRDGRAPV
jgi:pimeloyl-ACP methyl ester carboxylesterase